MLSHLRRWTKAQPEGMYAWLFIGLAYLKSDQTTKAIKAYQMALRINPENANAWFFLGIAYKVSGQTAKVMEDYKRLKTLDPAKADQFFNEVVLP